MIHIEQLHFAVGTFALEDVSLHVRPGEYFALLGPSGAGKTLLVECLCGLCRIDRGRIRIDGRDVTHLEPRHRGIGYLPQDYALFPHRTVRQNIAFGLQHRGLRAAAIRRRVDRLMDQLDVAHLADRYPKKLSGGEKQRAALARALAIEPNILLLDEPVSALDEQTRDSLCRRLKDLQQATGTTTIHVCHNFVEMLAVADRVGVIHQGRVLQVDAPRAVLERPNSTRVARFVQAGNLLPARARCDGPRVRLACSGGPVLWAPKPDWDCDAAEVVAMVRPEHIRLAAAGPGPLTPDTSAVEGTIRHVADMGPLLRVVVACTAETELLVLVGRREYNSAHVGAGDRVYLTIAAEDVHVLASK